MIVLAGEGSRSRGARVVARRDDSAWPSDQQTSYAMFHVEHYNPCRIAQG